MVDVHRMHKKAALAVKVKRRVWFSDLVHQTRISKTFWSRSLPTKFFAEKNWIERKTALEEFFLKCLWQLQKFFFQQQRLDLWEDFAKNELFCYIPKLRTYIRISECSRQMARLGFFSYLLCRGKFRTHVSQSCTRLGPLKGALPTELPRHGANNELRSDLLGAIFLYVGNSELLPRNRRSK